MTPSLSVLVPVEVDNTTLISSTVPEADYAAWAAGTAYVKDAFCISPATHRIYQCMTPHTGKNPDDVTNRAGTTVYWLDIGPTNRWAMFDEEVSTQTVAASPLTVVLRPGSFSGLYLAGVDAGSISITVKDAPSGVVIYSYTGQLEGSQPADYDEYFFDRFKPLTDFLASDIEQYNSAELTLTLSSAGGAVKCGVLAIGDLRSLGRTQYGAKAKPKTYSYIKTDDFGRTSIKRRKTAMDMSASAHLDVSEANAVTDIIRSVLDVPAVWIASGLQEYGFLRVFGLGSAEISADGPGRCQLSLNVQGLI
ncbi:hypothetical protein [Massilia alkalitolerans]|uniref:hypothetical protein n=1 Tax=Massilia alkalitolerans TaxID=286638 RepID=UPI0004082848|nr:hypothetical protein [Massilia alkalitolerans]